MAGLRHLAGMADVVVVGAGMSGYAAALAAADEGAEVILVHDRPVLGGNASSEVRVNLEGANGGMHNRYYLEAGLAEDLLLLNFWRNPTGSADHWCALLYDEIRRRPTIKLHLDTVVDEVDVSKDGAITAVAGLTLGAETRWRFSAPLFVDATGDGSVAYLAGAEFMLGEEAREQFGEPLAPLAATDLKLGGTMQFMCRDVGRPVLFEPPSFARKVTREELEYRGVNVWQQEPVLGGFWWIEYGGDLDTIYNNPQIKEELLAEVYGIWDFIKNDPEWKDKNANLDLEWVATMPGKRESRRILGDYVVAENDLFDGKKYDDAVSFGGWTIDRHPPRGFMDFGVKPCVQVNVPALYQLPLRSFYARDVPNLFLAGRDISVSHVTTCSSRVMLTCLHGGEAVGVAAAVASVRQLQPRGVVESAEALADVRTRLERRGHYVPYVELCEDRLPIGTEASASSEGTITQMAPPDRWVSLRRPRMVSLPPAQALEGLELRLLSARPFTLRWRCFGSRRDGGWLPGDVLAEGSLECDAAPAGEWFAIALESAATDGYTHFAFAASDAVVDVAATDERPYGVLSWVSAVEEFDAVPADRRAEAGWELPALRLGNDDASAFIASYWRREGHSWGGRPGASIALRTAPDLVIGGAHAVLEPWERPTPDGVHGWVSARADGQHVDGRYRFAHPEWLELRLAEPTDVQAVEIFFNSDLERHLANIWYSHPAGVRAMSTIVSDFAVEVEDGQGSWRTVAVGSDNFEARRRINVGMAISAVRIVCAATHGEPCAVIRDIRLRRG